MHSLLVQWFYSSQSMPIDQLIFIERVKPSLEENNMYIHLHVHLTCNTLTWCDTVWVKPWLRWENYTFLEGLPHEILSLSCRPKPPPSLLVHFSPGGNTIHRQEKHLLGLDDPEERLKKEERKGNVKPAVECMAIEWWWNQMSVFRNLSYKFL